MSDSLDKSFSEVVNLIRAAKTQAYRAVNTVLVDLYWQVGEYVSRKVEAGTWGEGTVDQLAAYIAERHPDIRGFTRANLYRMRQFYEIHRSDENVAPLVRQLPWSHNLVILGRCKRPEEREFYVKLAVERHWSRRELEREMDRCVFELKIDDFKPEYLGKLEFYLEALDRDVRKPHEKPSVGVLLCKSKDSEVVEYALSRSLSPAVVAQYRTQLPDKALLQRKLHEFYELEAARRLGEDGEEPG